MRRTESGSPGAESWVLRTESAVPSSQTTRRPRTWSRVYPWRNAFPPEAFVATMPPTVQVAALAGSGANRRPTFASSAFSSAHVRPAATVAQSGPTARMRRKCTLRSTTSPGPSASPASPVPAAAGDERQLRLVGVLDKDPQVGLVHRDGDRERGDLERAGVGGVQAAGRVVESAARPRKVPRRSSRIWCGAGKVTGCESSSTRAHGLPSVGSSSRHYITASLSAAHQRHQLPAGRRVGLEQPAQGAGDGHRTPACGRRGWSCTSGSPRR